MKRRIRIRIRTVSEKNPQHWMHGRWSEKIPVSIRIEKYNYKLTPNIVGENLANLLVKGSNNIQDVGQLPVDLIKPR
jgi:hypothetical protein